MQKNSFYCASAQSSAQKTSASIATGLALLEISYPHRHIQLVYFGNLIKYCYFLYELLLFYFYSLWPAVLDIASLHSIIQVIDVMLLSTWQHNWLYTSKVAIFQKLMVRTITFQRLISSIKNLCNSETFNMSKQINLP